jgi:predicted Zn-ribbon and HTH transcriptional regulator
MVTLRQAAKLALKALEHAEKDVADFQRLNTDQVDDAITALRQALEAEQQPETCKACGDGQADLVVMRVCDKCGSEYSSQAEFDLAMRLRAEQQADRIPDAGKMVQQAEQASVKDSLTAQAEPVAWMYQAAGPDGWNQHLEWTPTKAGYHGAWKRIPLYTHPQPAQQPLTDEALSLIGSMVSELRAHRYCGDCYPENGWPEVNKVLADYAAFKRARAIERAHHITGETK